MTPNPMDTAPRDGTVFHGVVDNDLVRVFWHQGFGEFISSYHRLEMAPGYLINGKPYEDHSPVVHRPTGWIPLLEGQS